MTNGALTTTTTTTSTTATVVATVRQGPSAVPGKIRVHASQTSRGNCLVATDLIRQGERISSSPPPSPSPLPPVNRGDGEGASWKAFVAPVLLENQRSTRCALCFGKLKDPPLRYEENPWRQDRPLPYVVLFCSQKCRTRGSVDHGLDREQSLALALYEVGPGPPQIFSTAILLYRLVNASEAILNEFNRLQGQLPEGRHPTDENEQHTRVVMATVAAMGHLHQVADFRGMIHRIKINGFSIADGESIALGIGVFSLPSFINHSCRPNVIQTFRYGQQNQPPTLWLTAYQDIPSGQEVTLSYIDNSSPRHLRQRRLLEDYYFLCDCPGCNDPERESSILGVRCPVCRDDSRPLQVVADPGQTNPLSLLSPLQCSICCSIADTAFHTSKFKWLEMPDNNDHDDVTHRDLSNLQQAFQNIKKECFPGSWYQEEMGDRLVHALLDKLGQSHDMEEQEKYATEALQILNYLVVINDDDMTTRSRSRRKWSSTSLEYRRAIQWFQMAKLSLLLYPDPTRAIQWLEKAYTWLSVYYPSGTSSTSSHHHELILDLNATMQQARM